MQLEPMSGEVFLALSKLQNNLETQNKNHIELLAGVTAQWEQRIAGLEEAMNAGLRAATCTAASISERANKVIQLGEVLQQTVSRMEEASEKASVCSWDSSGHRMMKLEEDVQRLEQVIERSGAKLDGAGSDASSLTSWGQRLERKVDLLTLALRAQEAQSTATQDGIRQIELNVERLAKSLTEETIERQRNEGIVRQAEAQISAFYDCINSGANEPKVNAAGAFEMASKTSVAPKYSPMQHIFIPGKSEGSDRSDSIASVSKGG